MLHALIIEDEWFLAVSMEESLTQLGYTEFDIVSSVSGAVEAAKRRCPDLIIANHQINGGTGTDAVLAICADKAIAVVFVTASGPLVRERLPDAYIVEKPFEMHTLRTAVAEASLHPFQSPNGGARN